MSPAEPAKALTRCCHRWSLQAPRLHATSPLAFLYAATLPDGTGVMLKIFTPLGLKDEWDGANLLQWYQGKSAVRVFGLADDALLMERLDGDSLMSLCDRGRTHEAAMIAAKLVANARAQDAPPPHLKTLPQRFDFLFSFPEPRIPAAHKADIHKAKTLARRLLADAAPFVPLHGDLHFRNVLRQGQNWRLIDPKGLLGPPAYDLANLFINPWDRTDIILANGHAGQLAQHLSESQGYDKTELLGWAVAHCALAACWSIANGASGRHPLTVLPYLTAEYDTSSTG